MQRLAILSHWLTCEYQRWQRNAGHRPPNIHSLKPGEKHSWWELGARKRGFGEDKFYFRYTKIEAIPKLLIRTLDMSALCEEPQGVLMLGPASFTVNLYISFQKLFLSYKVATSKRENGFFLLPSHHLYLQQMPIIMPLTRHQFQVFIESGHMPGWWSCSPHRLDGCTSLKGEVINGWCLLCQALGDQTRLRTIYILNKW